MQKQETNIPSDVAECGHEAIEIYKKAIANGSSEKFAIMVALQQAPSLQGTESQFMHGRMTEGGDTMIPDQRRQAEKEARQAGISTSGKFYMGGLADKRGYKDAGAWVGSRSDVLNTAKRRKLELRGQVNYTPPVKAKPKRKDISDRALRELTKKEMAKNPSLKKGDAQELVKEKYIPAWKRRRKD